MGSIEGEELEESREIFWSRDSSASQLEPPSTAIVEGLRQRQFEDWVAQDSENWLELIAQIVGDLDLPLSSNRLLPFPESKKFKPLSEFMLVERGNVSHLLERSMGLKRKLISVDKQTNDNIMHHNRFRKANRLSS